MLVYEGHVTFSAGLARKGLMPFASPYLPILGFYMQRAYDEVIHDVALQKSERCFCLDRAGLVGPDGHRIMELSICLIFGAFRL